jgi:hypothetical protein
MRKLYECTPMKQPILTDNRSPAANVRSEISYHKFRNLLNFSTVAASPNMIWYVQSGTCRREIPESDVVESLIQNLSISRLQRHDS